MNRRGFTIIELLIVIAVITLLGAIGYSQYSKVMMKAKAQKVANSLREIQKAVADTLGQAGGYYQSTGTAGTLKVASPQPLTNPIPGQNCGLNAQADTDNVTIEYLTDDGTPALDTTCYARKIEKDLHDNLVSLGMKWVPTTHDFRLPTAPLAHISFPFEVNGVRTIRIWGIQGDLAFKVFQTMNGTKGFSNEDGTTTDKPIAIAKISIGGTGDNNGQGGEYGAGTELPCLANLDKLDTPAKSFNCIVTGNTDGTRDSNIFYVAGEEEKAKNAPKVVLYYTYAFGYQDDNAEQTNTDTQ